MMTRKLCRPAVLVCALTALLLGALTLGPYMHESDQGWLLEGGVAVAQGHWDIACADFNFDKQFVSYLLLGGVIHFLPKPLDPDTLVLTANVFALVLFWGAFLVVLIRARPRLPFAVVLPVILTPAFLVHSPFFASAIISAGFILLLAAFLDRKRWTWAGHAVVFVLAFCAVGARVDGILLLPLLAMLHSPRRTMESVLRAPATRIMATAGLAAFLLGREIYDSVYFDDFAEFPFRLKQLLVCVACGLAGTGVVLLLIFHAVWRARLASHSRIWLVFLAGALALPLSYYCPQMLSTRHCLVAALSVVVFLGAPSGRAILHLYFRRARFGRALKFALVLVALAPVLVGLNLAEMRHPRLTLFHPTLLPSHAGVFPVGAFLGNALNFHRLHGCVDHNQPVWVGAKTVPYQATTDGFVPLIADPMNSYMFLCIRLQGKTPRPYTLGLAELSSWFYVDSRSLMRFAYEWPPERMSAERFFGQEALTPVTAADWHGITVLRGDSTAPLAGDSLSESFWALNEVFAGDEFRLESTNTPSAIPEDWAGKKLVMASRGKFSLAGAPTSELHSPLLGRWYYCAISPVHGGDSIHLQTTSAEKVFVATSVYPAWISLRKF